MTTPPSDENPDDRTSDYPQSPDELESGYQVPPAYLPPPADYPYDGPPPPGYPHNGPPPSGYPYQGFPPAPGYPYQQWQQPPPSRISIGMVFAGCGIWAIINVIVALVAILASAGAASGSDNVILGTAALGLIATAFGGGGALLAARNRHAKGLGLGLMIGWALTSLFTVGVCTGINPGMYNL